MRRRRLSSLDRSYPKNGFSPQSSLVACFDSFARLRTGKVRSLTRTGESHSPGRISQLKSTLEIGSSDGDTIVEVLLSIAIVSSVLGGAFISANRSLRGAQVSQERGEALKLVEGQLERVKAASKDDSKASAVFGATGDFCLDDALVPQPPCSQGPEGRYTLAIRRTGDAFTASARWDKIGGGPQEEVVIMYRAYQP